MWPPLLPKRSGFAQERTSVSMQWMRTRRLPVSRRTTWMVRFTRRSRSFQREPTGGKVLPSFGMVSMGRILEHDLDLGGAVSREQTDRHAGVMAPEHEVHACRPDREPLDRHPIDEVRQARLAQADLRGAAMDLEAKAGL